MAAKNSLKVLVVSLLISSFAMAQTAPLDYFSNSGIPYIPVGVGGNIGKPVDMSKYPGSLFPIGQGLANPPPGLIKIYDLGKVSGPLTVGGSSIFSQDAFCRTFIRTHLKEGLSEAQNSAEILNAAYFALKNIFSIHKLLDDRWTLNATEKNILGEIRSELKQWDPDFAAVTEQICAAEKLEKVPRLTEEQAQYTREALEFIRQVMSTTEFGIN